MRTLRRLLDSPGFYFTLAGLLFLVLIASQLRIRRPPRPAGGVAELAQLRERRDLNVVFLLIDALRSDRLGVAGYPRPVSPNLDSLASGGVRFTQTRAQSSWTKPSMASLLTSTSPSSNRNRRWEDVLPDAATLPAEIFHAAGIRTLGLYRNQWMAPGFGFGQGFDSYYVPAVLKDASGMRRNSPSVGEGLQGSDADLTLAAKQFLQSYGRERFFLYLHYMDVHQYKSDAESPTFGTSHSDFYDSAISWVDRNVGELVAELERLDLARRTLIVVTSDHGEEFGEHGGEGHGRTLYHEVTDVPWILVLPFGLERSLVIETPVASLDVVPTVLDLVGLPQLPEAEGVSALPLIDAALRGAAPPAGSGRPVFAELDRSWEKRDSGPDRIASVADGSERLIRTLAAPARVELFDLSSDPLEQTNLAEASPAARDRLLGLLSDHLARPAVAWGAAPPVELDRLSREQLRALGYLVE